MLKETNRRRGFLEHSEFQKLRAELPEHLRAILTMAYFTGMRLGEILKLTWSHVCLKDGTLDLSHGTTKNDEARTVPLASELLEMLKIEREKNKTAEFVFVLQGKVCGLRVFVRRVEVSLRAGWTGEIYFSVPRV